MLTSRPSDSDARYCAPVCGAVALTLPVVSGRAAKAARSSVRAAAALAIVPSLCGDLFDYRTFVRCSNGRYVEPETKTRSRIGLALGLLASWLDFGAGRHCMAAQARKNPPFRAEHIGSFVRPEGLLSAA